MSRPMFDPVLRIGEAADALHVSRRTIDRLIKAGRLEAIAIEGIRLVRGASLENLINHPDHQMRVQ
jgi:excisionase family DNA binding protein